MLHPGGIPSWIVKNWVAPSTSPVAEKKKGAKKKAGAKKEIATPPKVDPIQGARSPAGNKVANDVLKAGLGGMAFGIVIAALLAQLGKGAKPIGDASDSVDY